MVESTPNLQQLKDLDGKFPSWGRGSSHYIKYIIDHKLIIQAVQSIITFYISTLQSDNETFNERSNYLKRKTFYTKRFPQWAVVYMHKNQCYHFTSNATSTTRFGRNAIDTLYCEPKSSEPN